ncbi:hypothetical protein OEZ86_003857 [Tetradesmus obliquus]|nr:hypothetical protein OEZ86_003857 [Tetradesmus obliquus]
MGWAQVANDVACVPIFAFTTRKGANYPADSPGLPLGCKFVLRGHVLVVPQLAQQQQQQQQQQVCVHPGVELYHLFGFDCMVDAEGCVVLLEVNSYPAIARGIMSGVNAAVFTRLVGDLVRLMVLPVADGVPPEPGGFVEVA